MTVTSPVSPDLVDTPCTVAECLERAHVMGRAIVRVNPDTAAPPDFAIVTLGLPLCTNHAHLLHRGCVLSTFDSGL